MIKDMKQQFDIINNKRVLKTKRPRTPDSFPLNIQFLDKSLYRIISNGDDTYTLYVSPLIQNSLNEIRRGRTSFHMEQKLTHLTRLIKDRMSTQVRSIIKKSISTQKLINVVSSNGDDKMFMIDVVIKKTTDSNEYEILNPNKR